jgi:CubicO group peptidase (beta-lactamase class C family)
MCTVRRTPSARRLRETLRVALALAPLTLPNAASAQRPDLVGFDAYVAKAVKDWGIPGLAIAVVKGDSVVFAKGYGVRQLGKPDLVDAHTLFAIGSTTKAMTALSLLQLVDDDRLALDDPVVRHLPTLQLYDPVMTRELTVRDVLTHHTGLPGADQLWAGNDYSTAEIIRRMRWLKPAASFRSRYAYQNVQYAMAGEVATAVSGTPWAELLRTRIWTPLGMTETVPTLAATAGLPNVATPHMKLDDTVRVVANRTVDPVAPAGAVWSSVSDMAKWMRFVLDSGRAGGRRLVEEPSFVDWLSPQVVVPKPDFYPTTRLTRPHQINYGLGWFLHDYAGESVAMHTGSIDGMSAIIGLIPDRRVGVYVLANLDHAELRHALMYRIFDMYAGRSPRDWSTDLRTLYGDLAQRGIAARKAFEAARVQGTKPALPLDRYAGTYADSLNGGARVTADGGMLRVIWGKGFGGSLDHWHYETFIARWDDRRAGTALVTFVLDATGAPSTLRIDDTEFGRVMPEPKP